MMDVRKCYSSRSHQPAVRCPTKNAGHEQACRRSDAVCEDSEPIETLRGQGQKGTAEKSRQSNFEI